MRATLVLRLPTAWICCTYANEPLASELEWTRLLALMRMFGSGVYAKPAP